MNKLASLRQCLTHFPELKQALLFGSVAQNKATEHSDIDIAVMMKAPLTPAQRQALIEQITLATGRPVDLIDLTTVGEPLLDQIVTTGIRLVGSDEDFAALMMRNVIANADFVPLQQRLLKERLKKWIES